MASDQYHHGVDSYEINEGVRPIPNLASNIIGMVCTAEDADVSQYPLNTPILLTSIQDGLEKAGTKGTLARSLDAILDQADTACVIVRVEEGETEAETTANIIGSAARGKQTGINALRLAKTKLNVTPRILGVPVFDNAEVTAEAISVAQALKAFVYAKAGDFEDPAEAVAYQEQFGARELMLIDGNFLSFDTVAKATKRDVTIARALGMRARLDQEQGFQKTLSNVAVNGVTGIERPRSWGLQDKNTDLNYLNEHNVTGLIQQGGFRFWGSRTTSEDPLFLFENYTRTAHMLSDTIAEAHFWAIDKDMHASWLVDLKEGIQAKLDEWTLAGRILGGRVWVDPRVNTKERVKSGIFEFDYDYTPVPPLERLGLRQRITDTYVIDLVNQVVNSSAGARQA